MKDVINSLAIGSGGATAGGVASGQLIIAALGLFFMILFGAIGMVINIQNGRRNKQNREMVQADSVAIREALKAGDLLKAVEVHSGRKN